MRHQELNKRFGRNKSQRKQLMRSLVRGLFISYGIRTTTEKAKEARRLAERLITLAKKSSLQDIRAINDLLQDRPLTKKLIQQISPLFKDRNGGYTRVIRTGFRKGDGAPLAVLELVEKPTVEKKPKRPKKEKVSKPAEEELKEEKPKPIEKKPKPVEEKPKPREGLPEKKAEKLPQEKVEKPAEKKEGFLGRFRRFFKI